MKSILEAAISDQVTPCLAASVSMPTQSLMQQYYLACDENTLYDLASLTKILATTLISAYAIDINKLKLDEEPWGKWPGVSIAHVLNHTAGLAPIEDKILHPPGKATLYSDIGFMALGRLLEQRLNSTLDVICSEIFPRYYGDVNLRFNVRPANDERCLAMGGVAGHAGLFGDLNSVVKAGEFFLRALQGNEPGVPAVLREFASYKSERPLGFDKVTVGGSTGEVLSDKTRGHLGFTGTSLWVDPVMGAVFVLLTNRVYFPDRDLTGIQRLRIEFHRAAVSWLMTSRRN